MPGSKMLNDWNVDERSGGLSDPQRSVKRRVNDTLLWIPLVSEYECTES